MHRISRLALLIGGIAAAQFATRSARAEEPNKPSTSDRNRDRTQSGNDQTGSEQGGSTGQGGHTGTGYTGTENKTHGEAGKGGDEMSRFLDRDMTDAELANKIHAINVHEIQMAKLAATNASNRDVKLFADKLVKDHQDADKKLTDVARKMGIELTSTMPEDAEHQQKMQSMMDELKGMTGTDFDRHFLMMMQGGHDMAIMLLTAQSFAHPAGKELKNFVKTTLPTLESHRKKAIDLLEKIGEKTPAAS
jgi:putative membrane protein